MNLDNYQNEVERTVSTLKKGGTILYPTDTIWGLGCDALNGKAVERIFVVKQRPENKTNRYICVAPASLWFTKQYPEEKWIDFIKQLDPNLCVYFLGGPNDVTLCNNIIKESQHPFSINLAGKLS